MDSLLLDKTCVVKGSDDLIIASVFIRNKRPFVVDMHAKLRLPRMGRDNCIYSMIQAAPLWNETVSPNYQHSPKIPKAVWTMIGDRVSKKEKMPVMNADPSQFITLRLDGHGFSRLVKKLRSLEIFPQGYSPEFADIMQKVLQGLMTEYNAAVGFTQSDEITIILPAMKSERAVHPYAGRRDKLETLSASYASQLFTRKLLNLGASKGRPLPDQVTVLFDCRMAVDTTMASAFELIAWRAYDCSVNGVSTAVMNSKAPKQVREASTGEKLAWLVSSGVLPLPDHEAYGTLYVKTKVAVQSLNPMTQEPVEVQRGVVSHVPGAVLRNIKNGTLIVTDDAIIVPK
jgi:tRNA(His) 5'-end guanylyltransferase